MYNKNNLKNIYEYDPKLINKINKKVKEYKSYVGYSYHYEYLIESINQQFNTSSNEKEYKDFIYHLANDRIYTKQSLIKIFEYAKCLEKASKHNDYTDLLEFVKSEENVKDVKNYYDFLKNRGMYDIWYKNDLIQDVSYDLSADPYDGTAENILDHLLNDNLADWIQIKDRYRDNTLIEFKNEEEVLKKLYKLHYEKFNKKFFDNLDLLEMERVNYREMENEKPINVKITKPKYNEAEQKIEIEEIEMEM